VSDSLPTASLPPGQGRPPDAADASPAWDGEALRLAEVAAPLALCDAHGRLLTVTASARELLIRVGVVGERLPASLWALLRAAGAGEAALWRPEGGALCLGATRYAVGEGHALLLMREVSDKQRELSQRMHQQRLEATGSLVTAIAHDIRGALASVIFNADVLATRGARMDATRQRPFLAEILDGAERLKEIVDGLLDFARLPSTVASATLPGAPPPAARQPVTDLEPLLQRCASLLRPKFRDGAAELTISHASPALRVLGNPLIIEQIVNSLLHNAVEAGAHLVCIHCEPAGDGRVRVRVHDDGPGIARELQPRIFEPFFTTRPSSTGLGLSTAREAARHIGGDLLLDTTEHGASLSLLLRADGGAP
jgi:signal transduction histidine kinase